MLAVDGDFVVESAGMRIRFEATGAVLVASIDGGSALTILRRIRVLAPFARRFVPLLVRAGLTVDVVAGNVRVARAGAGIEANRLARMLDLPGVRLGR